ncbi:MAG: ribonuclease R [Proteobacteria bacterium]|nr:ribonuclease R [Pseudomonadota bacterium]
MSKIPKPKVKVKSKDPFFKRESQKYKNPIPSREFILDVMKEHGTPIKKNQLIQLLGIQESEEEILSHRLKAMRRDGQILKNRKDVFCVAEKLNCISGKVQGHADGYGFLIPDDSNQNDIFLSQREMTKVFHNDRVMVQISGLDRKGKAEGTIIEILERNNKVLVGRVIQSHGVTIVSAEDKRINQDILIPYGKDLNAVPGDIVEVEITTQPAMNIKPMGQVIEIIGKLDDSGIEIEIALRKHNLSFRFDKKVDKELTKIKDICDKDFEDRIDLRKHMFVTIDGETAKDFDDAVYAERDKDGYRLMVAIADVSHYVEEETELDKEAFNRGNSVYFPRRVIPMLPEILSNGLCSLNPNVDRLVMVADMKISNSGEVYAYKFYPGVINSKFRLTYTIVDQLIFKDIPDQEYPEELVKKLLALKEVYQTLSKQRKQRHAIEFDRIESQIIFDESGKIKNVVPLSRNEAHRMIEECMLAANVSAADFLLSNDLGLFRNHEKPKEEKIEILKSVLSDFKVHMDGGIKPDVKDYGLLLEKIKQKENFQMLQTMVLRSMQQANYSSENKGHFGLAYEMYTHFTSPIRRYPDLVVHRVIKSILNKRKFKTENLESIANHCSATERRADEATRDVENWLKCFFMKDRIGEKFEVITSSVTNFGLFVEIPNLHIEGLLHVTELGNDYFVFNKEKQMLEGEKTKKKFRLGDELSVKLIRVDLELGKIDFSLIKKIKDA